MYYTQLMFDSYVIMKSHEEDVVVGPFSTEQDASFVCGLLNQGKMVLAK